ncbi:hypothetical protein WMY93_008357 [Mugilogobius chulae]|uniref:Uncharacterized protein n=1 Tax=Mugilogobius chulae TaxID=88201 RepID=A0AAW0PS96_9GOBI
MHHPPPSITDICLTDTHTTACPTSTDQPSLPHHAHGHHLTTMQPTPMPPSITTIEPTPTTITPDPSHLDHPPTTIITDPLSITHPPSSNTTNDSPSTSTPPHQPPYCITSDHQPGTHQLSNLPPITSACVVGRRQSCTSMHSTINMMYPPPSSPHRLTTSSRTITRTNGSTHH